MIKAGELREKITIGRKTRTPNSSGGAAYAPAVLYETFARVRELKSDPSEVASKDNIKQLVEFMIRHRTDVHIENGDDLTWRGFDYKVHSIKVDPMRTKITILAFQVMNTSRRSSQDPVPPQNDTFDFTFDNTFK